MSEKITSQHLRRSAYIYVRQSSVHQVRHHKEGQRRQYALADRARDLGFARTVVIDEDQGRSGGGLQERPGFGKLLTAVCEGDAGAVFALEASRLARNNRDWHHLIDLCALTEALIIDEEGIYDPRHLNDRLLLGLKGTMSEFELGLLRQRARQAFEQKVRRGHALWELPVGFVRTEEHRIEMIADRQVQEAIRGVFSKFRELGSARQTLLWYRDEQVPLPQARAGTAGKDIVWRLPTATRMHQILKNPCYAGALAYGRTAGRMVMHDGRARHGSRRRLDEKDWKVLIRDNHTGYITWEQYLEHQKILQGNLIMQTGQTGGAAKRGEALLSGLLRCGRCARKLTVVYAGNGGRVPRYCCGGGREHRGNGSCLSVGALRVDRVVAEQVLEAVQPAGIEAALLAVEQARNEQSEKLRSLELSLEKARYEVDRAQRQYDAVDPANRLVAAELEARWNKALEVVSALEERISSERQKELPFDEQAKARLMELGADLRQLWDHLEASMPLRKRIIRTVLKEIVIDKQEQQHMLQLHWQGGIHTRLHVRRNGSGKHRHCTKRDVIELIGELSKVCDDKGIAATLNRLGYRTGAGKTWRTHSVVHVRSYYRLANFRNDRQWVTVSQAARDLGVSDTVVKRLIRQKILPATQAVKFAPWVIEAEHLTNPAVQAAVNVVRQGRRLPSRTVQHPELPMKSGVIHEV
jgi:DNA invertase Pin-like site-specific DNA recombinase